MHFVRFASIVPGLLAGSLAAGDPPARLIVNAGVTSVTISRLDQNRRPLRLDTLDIPIRVEAECEPGTNAASISISVADTREAHRFSESSGPMLIDTTLQLPDRQIAPIVIEGFCTPDDGAHAVPQLLVPDAFTAQVSLHCAGESHQSMHYAVAPIDLRLSCDGDTESMSGPDKTKNKLNIPRGPRFLQMAPETEDNLRHAGFSPARS